MNNEWINNYEAAREIDVFNEMYIETLNKRVQEAKKILDDPKYPWKEKGRDKALNAFKEIEGKLINFTRLYNAVFKLVEQHEKLTGKLYDIYYQWYENIAYEGKQPKELMSGQVDILQEIFTEIYNFIEPIVEDEKIEPNGKI